MSNYLLISRYPVVSWLGLVSLGSRGSEAEMLIEPDLNLDPKIKSLLECFIYNYS